jgi:FtsH-binding integral membrane protein
MRGCASGEEILGDIAGQYAKAGDNHGSSMMSNFDRNAATIDRAGRATSAVIDQGLRAYMLRVYNYMTLGLAITGLAALGIFMLSTTTDPALAGKVARAGAEVPAQIRGGMYLTPLGVTLFLSYLKWVIIVSPLVLVFAISFLIERMRPATAQLLFWLFSALMGMSLSSIFMVYTQTSITRVFFITAATFGALSLWGYTTKRDISGWGSFLFMGLIGVILGSLVNLIWPNGMMQFVVSVVGVLVFAGLTAYDTQRLKNEYVYGQLEGDSSERSAIMGALSLYLNFINLFTLLLQLLGQRED